MVSLLYFRYFLIFPCFHITLEFDADSEDSSKKVDESTSPKPVHVAILTGCDSHFSITAQVASSLIRWPSVKNKYRVTYVTSANCRDRVEKLGATLHDTGLWYYPITDPDVGISAMYKNLSMGVLTNTVRSLESLMKADRPDVVITEPFGGVAGTVAEKYNVPFLMGVTMSFPSPRACKDGMKAPTPITPSIILDEDNPTWLLKTACTLYFHMSTVIAEVLIHEAHWKLNKIRKNNNQEPLDNLGHLLSYYPVLSFLGEPLTQVGDYVDKIYHIGVLPDVSGSFEYKMGSELKKFIDGSEKPIIYISLGTYFAFSEEYFEVIKKALEDQPNYNIIWSNKRWTPEMGERLNKHQFFMRTNLPQRVILESEKVKLFVSHCGVSSLIESIRAGVPVIGVPQGRDQFFLARNLQKAKIGIELTSEPDPTDLMQAIGTILSNWLLYHNRMKEVLHQLTYNSQENLERVIDMFAGKGHVVTFAEDGSLFPTWQAFALVGTVFCTALILTIGLVFCLARLFCRRMSGSKEKTN